MRARKAIRCVVVKSTVHPELMSLRLVETADAKDANDLRRALTLNFEEGDVVLITKAPKL